MCVMGSCIKVVKQKKWFSTENKKFSPVAVQNQNRRFSVMKPQIFWHRYLQNYKLTPAPSENCFAIFLLRVRSNNLYLGQYIVV
jgi:hypothetical protein